MSNVVIICLFNVSWLHLELNKDWDIIILLVAILEAIEALVGLYFDGKLWRKKHEHNDI